MNRCLTLRLIIVFAVLLQFGAQPSARADIAEAQYYFAAWVPLWQANSKYSTSPFVCWCIGDAPGVFPVLDGALGGNNGSCLSWDRCIETNASGLPPFTSVHDYLYCQYLTGELCTFNFDNKSVTLDSSFLNTFSSNLSGSMALTVGDSSTAVFYINSTSDVVSSLGGIISVTTSGTLPVGMSVVETAPSTFCLQGVPTDKGNYTVSVTGVIGVVNQTSYPGTLASPSYPIVLNVRDNRGALSASIHSTTGSTPAGMWRRKGTDPWFVSGAMETGIRIGTYTVEFQPIYGFETPADQQVTIQDDQITTISPVYVALPLPVEVYQPTVSSVAVSGTNPTAAHLSDSVTPNSFDTEVCFQYGLTTGYGQATKSVTAPAGGSTTITSDLSGLTAGATYHVQCVITNPTGTFVSPDRVFVTASGASASVSSSFGLASAGAASTSPGSSGTTLHELIAMNSQNRSTVIFDIGQSTVTGTVSGPTIPRNFDLRGLADFNNDGSADWLLMDTTTHRPVVWLMNGGSRRRVVVGAVLPAGFDLVGTADLTGDGKPDCLLLNKTTGQTAVWPIKGISPAGQTIKYGPILPAKFNVAGVADLNGDGKPDLLLWNPTKRQSKAVVLNSGKALSVLATFSGPVIPPGWRLVGAGTPKGSPTAGWILFNPTTCATAIWSMKSTTWVSTVPGPTLPAGTILIGAK